MTHSITLVFSSKWASKVSLLASSSRNSFAHIVHQLLADYDTERKVSNTPTNLSGY